MELHVSNVNQALCDGIAWLRTSGSRQESRNGPVIVSPEPVMTIYNKPLERVIFSPLRDANPFFHFFEALWMLAGRNDLKWPVYFNKRFGDFSDDGETIHGAYGYRWRHALGIDQLSLIAEELKRNPNTRRCHLQMWDASSWDSADLERGMHGGKDVPCNTGAFFMARNMGDEASGDRWFLDMTVVCRSNDIIWGAYGANAVHFSFLLEYMATRAGMEVGLYRQFSNNYHMYPGAIFPNAKSDAEIMEKLHAIGRDADLHDYYEQRPGFSPYPTFNTPMESWEQDLSKFFDNPSGERYTGEAICRDSFFTEVASPMYNAWYHRKCGCYALSELWMSKIRATDWRIACQEWTERRDKRRKAA